MTVPRISLSFQALRSLLGALQTLLGVLRIARREKPDAILVVYVDALALYFLIVARLLGRRAILSFRGSDVGGSSVKMRRRFFLSACVVLANTVLVKSNRMATDLSEQTVGKQLKRKLVVVQDGVDTHFWSPRPGAALGPSSPPLIVAAGNLRSIKGFDVLLRAVAYLHELGFEARCSIAGDGDERRPLEELAVRLRLQHSVRFEGNLSREALRNLYRRATVFALSSRAEGGPNVILEAMACGAPTVSTSVAWVPDVMPSTAGILVGVNDALALAVALREILAMDETEWRFASIAARQAAVGLSWDEAVHRYEAVLAQP